VRRAAAVTVALALGAAGCGGDPPPKTSGNAVDRAVASVLIYKSEAMVALGRFARRNGSTPRVREQGRRLVAFHGQRMLALRELSDALRAQGMPLGDLGVSEKALGLHLPLRGLQRRAGFDRRFRAELARQDTAARLIARIELRRGRDPRLRELARELLAGAR
jgi:hypothetical protein